MSNRAAPFQKGSRKEQLRDLVRVFGRTDGAPSWSAAKGHLYQYTDTAIPRAVCPFVSIRVHTFKAQGDGFVETLIAVIIPATDDGLSVRREHVGQDGERRELSLFPYRKQYFHCPETGTHRVSDETGQVEEGSIWSADHYAPFALDLTQSSGVGWINYINPHELMGKTWSDAYRFRVLMADLVAKESAFVPATYGYLGESPLPPWVGGSGQAVWQAWGIKAEAPSAVPYAIRELAGTALPELLKSNPFTEEN